MPDSAGPMPFERLRGRLLVPIFLIFILAATTVAGADPLTGTTALTVAYLILFGLLYFFAGELQVDLPALFGPRVSTADAVRIGGIALLALILNFGLLWAVYLASSLFAPDLAQRWLLSEPTIVFPGHLAANVVVLFQLVFVVPVVEEFLFRGLLLHRWSHCWGIRRGIVFSSIVFGILHASPLGLVAFGIIAAILYLQTRSLWAPILFHGVNNLAVWGISWLEVSRRGTQISTLEIFRDAWWSGAIALGVGLPWFVYFLMHNRRLFRAPPPALASATEPREATRERFDS